MCDPPGALCEGLEQEGQVAGEGVGGGAQGAVQHSGGTGWRSSHQHCVTEARPHGAHFPDAVQPFPELGCGDLAKHGKSPHFNLYFVEWRAFGGHF